MSNSLSNTFAAFAAVILAFASLNAIVTVPPASAQSGNPALSQPFELA
ncbi:MAG: hypothetical protein AAGK17_13235 [Pseudomonadota bacterium]